MPKSFTSLPDERLFLDENTHGVLCFQRAADALVRIVPLGVSHPVAETLFVNASDALVDAMFHNQQLFDRLDVERFFCSVRRT